MSLSRSICFSHISLMPRSVSLPLSVSVSLPVSLYLSLSHSLSLYLSLYQRVHARVGAGVRGCVCGSMFNPLSLTHNRGEYALSHAVAYARRMVAFA